MSLSAIIESYLKKTGTSSYRLARQMGVHTSTITNWRNGSTPNIEHLLSLSALLNVSIDELVRDTQCQG